jgi:hypothetical protein
MWNILWLLLPMLAFGYLLGLVWFRGYVDTMWLVALFIFGLFLLGGFLVLGGYGVRIVQEFTKGKFKNLPEMKFGDDMKLGFFMFLKAIPFVLAYTIVMWVLAEIGFNLDSIFGVLFGLFVLPILTINFMNKMTIESFFELKIVAAVFSNLGDYIMVLLKSIGLAIVFMVMIIVLVGIPAGAFTKNIFLADFYRRRVK